MSEQVPNGWVSASLSELGGWAGGGTPSKQAPQYWNEGTVPWVSPKDMKALFIADSIDHITELAAGETVARVLPAGGIAFVVRSGILSRTLPIAQLCTAAAVNQDMRVLLPSERINAKWLLYALLADADEILRECQKDGTTVASLDARMLANWRVAVPPRSEQDRIVEVVERLSAEIDAGRAALDSAIELLERLRLAHLRHAFRQEGGERVPLGQVVEVLDHKRVPINRETRARRPGDVPYYGATGQVGWIDEALFDEDLVLLGEDGVQFFDPFAQKAYTVSGPSWVNNHAHVLRPLPDQVRPTFLCHSLNAADYQGLANGTTRLKLTKSAMLRLNLAVPPLGEQDRLLASFDQQLSSFNDLEEELQSARRTADQLEIVMLRAARDGRLTPRAQDGDTADLLIAEIRAALSSQTSTRRKKQHAGGGVANA